ncbi:MULTISPECIES: ComF family protein [unclassified Duganella]|uniref:ComF family protein n=1 Tax=unclassified Duganella TaxID=2636909 RepID=UPI0006F760FB|nr:MULTISPECIES: ComF family protein [unclassified Duganella]KQV51086.1 amidophosphoribosyltransferase [Duganella sp. Root336D2]KRC00666.1 amidophosphoribosyltransferase [Duganella sp. Root198D2]
MAAAIANGLLAALLPCNCVLCGASGPALLCPGCHRQFFAAAVPRCPICANPLPPAPQATQAVPCGRCQAEHPAFDATVVAADYALPVDRLVLQLKFARQLALARLFAGLLADAVQRADAGLQPRPALLCPVPLGLQRLSERGFNQALEIARPLGKTLGIAVHGKLAVRVRDTQAQSSTPHGARHANIAHAFAIPERALVEGRHIGVVDDVMSSGQTLQELAATLKRYGAARVTNYVFARTPPNPN